MFFVTCDIKLPKPILAKILTQHGKNVFQNHISVILQSNSVASQIS